HGVPVILEGICKIPETLPNEGPALQRVQVVRPTLEVSVEALQRPVETVAIEVELHEHFEDGQFMDILRLGAGPEHGLYIGIATLQPAERPLKPGGVRVAPLLLVDAQVLS